MQFILAVSAFLSFAAVTVQAAPVAMVVARAPASLSTDCGVVGGKSCNIIGEAPTSAASAPTALFKDEIISPEATAPCGVVGSKSCN